MPQRPLPDGPSAIPQPSVDTTRPAPHPAAEAPPDDATLPHLPHERDQSVAMTDGTPSAHMQQAYRDVARGLVDTDQGRQAHSIGMRPRPKDAIE